ncbi:phosphopantetheine-binding protein [Streptomyces sp. ML-6]|uniref:phosphopantetheine-binding protein n=1 Tax=Streptomyces sp. ML-6 TaxID=2982693 RepID=UPI0024BFA6A5|nr:phosphopantetheine-binding protein [Streptomyces sp. ML-6]MDK0524157.1 phosphopantetheine-binding protein [Streptomyces sp. ML-6]
MSDRAGPENPGSTAAAPADPSAVIAGSWRAVLGVPALTEDDDFFELGGDSIMVTRIVSYLRRELGVEVDMVQVWETPLFGEFRDAVTAQMGEGTT